MRTALKETAGSALETAREKATPVLDKAGPVLDKATPAWTAAQSAALQAAEKAAPLIGKATPVLAAAAGTAVGKGTALLASDTVTEARHRASDVVAAARGQRTVSRGRRWTTVSLWFAGGTAAGVGIAFLAKRLRGDSQTDASAWTGQTDSTYAGETGGHVDLTSADDTLAAGDLTAVDDFAGLDAEPSISGGPQTP